MLLHARAGTGEREEADLNALYAVQQKEKSLGAVFQSTIMVSTLGAFGASKKGRWLWLHAVDLKGHTRIAATSNPEADPST